MLNERIKELEEILETVCEKHEDDCSKCPKQKECEEYSNICNTK
jgi:hypothetical protein